MAYYKCGSIYTTQNSNVVIDTASGSVANFNTPLALPLLKTEFDVHAVQDLHGEDGAYPAGAINKWDGEWEAGGIDSQTGENAPSSTQWRTKNHIPVLPNTEYYVCAPTSAVNKSIRVRFYDENKTYVGNTVASGSGVTNKKFETPSDAYFMRFSPNIDEIPNYDVSLNYPASDTTPHLYENICSISGVSEVNVTNNSEIIVINLDDTYYGGEVIINKNGKRQFKCTHKSSKFSDLPQPTYNSTWNFYEFSVSDAKQDNPTNVVAPGLMCECYTPRTAQQVGSGDRDASISLYAVSPKLRIKDKRFVNDITALMNDIGDYKIIYPIETPIIIDLPDGQPIKSLPGVNNIFADTGDTVVKFRKIGE